MVVTLFNQTCSNCSTSLPLLKTTATTKGYTDLSEFLTRDLAIILSIISSLACMIGCLGNSLVMLAVQRNETFRSLPDLFITSLAVSDFFVCALYLPMRVYYFSRSISENGGSKAFDYAISFLGHMSMVASASNMFAVTIDRIIAIRFPFKYVFMTTKHAVVQILLVWIVSLAFGVLYAPKSVSNMYIALYCSALLMATIVMYIYIFIIAKRAENRIQNTQSTLDRTVAERKVAKTVFTVVGAYALCWLPMLLLPAIANPSSNPAQFGKGFFWAQTFLASNSAINPYIYCMRSKKYRVAFGKILRIQHWIGH
ncbi:alpha-1A adrenergic receptor-like [Stylophora pistillata]|uniref:alpha-1A adrenergic receptor-like n=1 Tax=Stylophora pistillata TaxID=50429 RepID=UPI000C04D5BC|nr:alpha-1A adrenergic receptor-like [Stylophora pistillata]XP_022787892.1 alpha-1A adrenergic receptor-like [Stylophora pistillata]